ncbi:MAG: hypothetical protein CMP75_00620 [Flavobacteriales bacterium]|nr:hypothetical protein [Flavobacteriales bacterium]
MKKILLALLVTFGLNQTQAQMVSPCDSIDIVTSPNGSVSMEIMVGWNINSPLFIVSVDNMGNVLGEDSLSWTHYVYPTPALQTFTTCTDYVFGVDTLTCCVQFNWDGQAWAMSTGAIEDNEDLIGQWYSEEEGEYVTFTSDSIFIYSLENDCYEFMSMSYEIQSDTSFIATQEFQGMSFEMELLYAINNDNLTIVIDQEGDIEQYNYVSTNYDPSKLNLCSDFYTWICDNNSSCVEVAEGSGEFASEEECQWQCFSGEVTYECWDGDCYEAGDFGSYQSYEACVDVCELVDTIVTYNCIVGSCVESFFGEGEYNTLDECEEECGNNNEDITYECVLGACYENPLGNGTYASLEECEQNCNPSAIEEEEIGIQLVPNPFFESTLILLDKVANNYKLYDLSGKLVKHEKMNSKQTQIKRDNLPSGMYFLELYSDDVVIRKKLIIQ